MTQVPEEGEWWDKAIDDGSAVLKANDYAVEISSDRGPTISTWPTSLSYNPEKNTAKRISVDVPPHDELTSNVYLEGTLTLYVDGVDIFEGDIKRISDTERADGADDVSIRAFSQGQKLTDIDTEERVINKISSDYLGFLVDIYNDVPSTHDQLIGEGNRVNIQNIGGGVLQSSGSSGTVTYTEAGQFANELSRIYAKIYTPQSDTVDVTVETDTNSHTETFEGLDKNRYGEWVHIDPDSAFNGDSTPFDITYTLNGESLLIDWVVVSNMVLEREVFTPDIETVGESQQLYSTDQSNIAERVEDYSDGIYVEENEDANDVVRQRHIVSWGDPPLVNIEGDPGFINGEGYEVLPDMDLSIMEWEFFKEDTFEDWGIYFRAKPIEWFIYKGSQHRDTIYDDNWDESDTNIITDTVYTGDEAVEILDDTTRDCYWMWERDQALFHDLVFDGHVHLNGGNMAQFGLEQGPLGDDSNTDGYSIRIETDEIRLRRLDAGTPENLDVDTEVSIPGDEWIHFEMEFNRDGSINVDIDGNTLSSNDQEHTQLSRFTSNQGSNYYLDNLEGNPSNARSGNNINWNIYIEIDDEAYDYGTFLSQGYRNWGWSTIISEDFFGTGDLSGSTEVRLLPLYEQPVGFITSGAVMVHKSNKWDPDTDFDLDLHEPEGHLNRPYRFATGDVFDTNMTFREEVSSANISESTINASISNTTNPVGEWGPVQVIDISEDFPNDYPNSQNETRDYPYPGVSHQTRVKLTASGSERDATPRVGYEGMEIHSFDVEVDTNDLTVLFDRAVSGNNLNTMSNIADDTNDVFRFEGGYAKIFQEGLLHTDVNLRKEQVDSERSSEEAYSSVEVVGLHGVRSGVLESTEAPDWLDSHKKIRDDSIERDSDAISRGRAFLKSNGDIQYEGEITTLPTFAPIGEVMSGDNFSHGQDMVIESVRYSKRRARITLGKEKSVAREIVNIETSGRKTTGRETSKGMRIPSGEDQV